MSLQEAATHATGNTLEKTFLELPVELRVRLLKAFGFGGSSPQQGRIIQRLRAAATCATDNDLENAFRELPSMLRLRLLNACSSVCARKAAEGGASSAAAEETTQAKLLQTLHVAANFASDDQFQDIYQRLPTEFRTLLVLTFNLGDITMEQAKLIQNLHDAAKIANENEIENTFCGLPVELRTRLLMAFSVAAGQFPLVAGTQLENEPSPQRTRLSQMFQEAATSASDDLLVESFSEFPAELRTRLFEALNGGKHACR